MREQLGEDVRRSVDLRPVGIVALAAAMVLSTAIAAGSWKEVRKGPSKHSIRVTGSAKRRIVSDQIQWEADLDARAPERTAAFRMLRDERDKAVAFLIAQGIKADEIQPQSTSGDEEFEVQEEFKMIAGAKDPVRIEKKISKGFVARGSILVRSSDVARVEKASREITSLLEQGVSVSSNAPLYLYTHLSELKLEMLAAAGKDTRTRAENILRTTGATSVGKLIAADMGIINVNPANSSDTSEEGNSDTTSLEKDIITIVHAEFEIDQ